MSPVSRSGSMVGCTTTASPTSTRCRTMSGRDRSTVFRSIGHPRCWSRLGATTRMGGIMPVGRYFLSLAVLAAASLASLPALAQTAKASLKDASGKDVGQVALLQTPHGVLLKLTVKGVPAGEHAFHVHAGDMPNLFIPASGELTVEIANPMISLVKGQPNSVFDADGSAFIIHAGADDYKTDPTGNAGDRIACGVIVE